MKKSNLFRTSILAGSLLLQLSALCFQSRGAAGDVDPSFDPGSGVNGPVNAIAVQPDGKVIIGGEFTTVKGLARSKVARLNVDGSGDSSFDAGTELEAPRYAVRAVALQSDGKVLVGHDYGITRLNSDGSLDNSFDQRLADTAPVYSVVVQSDGKVLIGGSSYFYTVIGTNSSYGIARLNSNGSLDHSFNPGTGIGPPPDESYSWVASIALQSDGKVLIGGVFYGVNDTSRVGIARLNADGSLDGTFDPGTGAHSGGYAAVNSVAVQSDGKVLIGGYFTSVNGTIRDGIARLNANGSLDNSFDPGTGAYAVTSVALQSDGKGLICGNFGSVDGTSRNRIARLNSNGSLDATFNPGTGVDWPVFSMALQSNGKVLIGGNFGTVNGTNRNNMARLNADGGLDANFQPGKGLDSYIFSVALQPDGKVLIGGVYTFINGANRYGRARLNADGSLESTFISDIFNPDLTALSSPVCPPGYECFDFAVATAVAVQPDGKILVGGYSVHRECDLNEGWCNDYYGYFVARHNSDGSRDTSFDPALGNPYGGESVQALALQPNGKVVVAGYFGSIKGTNRNGIARLNADGSLDNSFNPGTGVIGPVSSVALQADGKVLIGGGFYTVNGTNRRGIARLNADGSLDNSFNPGTGVYEVSSVALQPDGKVLIGGGFTIVNGTNRNRIARLNANGSLDITFNPGAGPNGRVRSLALQPDGKVLIGGDFSTVNGAARPHVARLYGDSVVVPSLNIARSNAFVIVSWPTTGLNFQLQETTEIALPNSWSPLAPPAVTNGNQISVIVPTTAGQKFFRLKSQ